MCKGSRHVANQRDAKVDEVLGIGSVKVHSTPVGAFHALGQTTAQCVACIEDGAPVAISGISQLLQRKYGLGYNERAIFVETEENTYPALDDQFKFPDYGNLVVNVLEFIDPNVRVSLKAPVSDAVVDKIKTSALAGADTRQPEPVA